MFFEILGLVGESSRSCVRANCKAVSDDLAYDRDSLTVGLNGWAIKCQKVLVVKIVDSLLLYLYSPHWAA